MEGGRRAALFSRAPQLTPPLSAPPFAAQSSIKKIDPEEIELDIDSIDATTFWTVDTFVKDCLPGGKKATKKKSGAGASGGAPVPTGALDSKAKKARIG